MIRQSFPFLSLAETEALQRRYETRERMTIAELRRLQVLLSRVACPEPPEPPAIA